MPTLRRSRTPIGTVGFLLAFLLLACPALCLRPAGAPPFATEAKSDCTPLADQVSSFMSAPAGTTITLAFAGPELACYLQHDVLPQLGLTGALVRASVGNGSLTIVLLHPSAAIVTSPRGESLLRVDRLSLGPAALSPAALAVLSHVLNDTVRTGELGLKLRHFTITDDTAIVTLARS